MGSVPAAETPTPGDWCAGGEKGGFLFRVALGLQVLSPQLGLLGERGWKESVLKSRLQPHVENGHLWLFRELSKKISGSVS